MNFHEFVAEARRLGKPEAVIERFVQMSMAMPELPMGDERMELLYLIEAEDCKDIIKGMNEPTNSNY